MEEREAELTRDEIEASPVFATWHGLDLTGEQVDSCRRFRLVRVIDG